MQEEEGVADAIEEGINQEPTGGVRRVRHRLKAVANYPRTV
jgi:hypothetical protein